MSVSEKTYQIFEQRFSKEYLDWSLLYNVHRYDHGWSEQRIIKEFGPAPPQQEDVPKDE